MIRPTEIASRSLFASRRSPVRSRLAPSRTVAAAESVWHSSRVLTGAVGLGRPTRFRRSAAAR